MIIEQQVALKQYNTFGVQVNAENFCIVTTKHDVFNLIPTLNNYDSYFILGGGSNILFTQDVKGLTIKNEIIGIHIIKENAQEIILEVLSGTVWHDVVLYCVQHNYQGIENLALIPGTAGAAPIQNIGAYGVELKEVLESVHLIDLITGEEFIVPNEACNFGYRDSIFKHEGKNKYFIYSITLKLKKENYTLRTDYGDIRKKLAEQAITQPSIAAIADAVIDIRKSKLPNPKELGNAGSFFKNPIIATQQLENIKQSYPNIPHYIIDSDWVKIPAAWLIEQCGFKGKRIGNTGNHAQQALVIVNYGNASGAEIWQHAQHVITTIKEQFNIQLEVEVNLH